MNDTIKKITPIICGVIVFVVIFIGIYCFHYNWSYYFFDVLAKFSPALAAIVALYTWSQNRDKDIKKLEYEFEYHKKILDLRLKAYGKVENLLFHISQKYEFKDFHKQTHEVHYLFIDLQKKEELEQCIEECYSLSMWLSDCTLQQLQDVWNMILAVYAYASHNSKEYLFRTCFNEDEQLVIEEQIEDIEKKIEKIMHNPIYGQNGMPSPIFKNDNKKYIAVGCVIYNKLLQESETLRKYVYEDLKCLYEVKLFLSNKVKEDKNQDAGN